MRIGMCEDDPDVRRVLADGLKLAGHDVLIARNGQEAIANFGLDSDLPAVDAIVMDIGLPDADGRDVCQALRANGQPAPVLFLTAYDAVHERISGFHAGGDDYVVKPFAIAEVVVRLESLARRHASAPAAASPGNPLSLDPQRLTVSGPGGETALTPTEFRLLAAIAAGSGAVVRRRAAVAAAWPDGAIVNENTIDSYVRRLRVKLAEVGAEAALVTVRGVGFAVR